LVVGAQRHAGKVEDEGKGSVAPAPALPRYVLIARDGGPISGDTAALMGEFYRRPKRLTPVGAACLIQSLICDYYPYKYRKVARDDPAATIDVYRVAPDYPPTLPASVERDCKYVTTLARIYPTCCFCNGPMVYGEQGPWNYGYDARPVAKGQCCSACFKTKVYPLVMPPPPGAVV